MFKDFIITTAKISCFFLIFFACFCLLLGLFKVLIARKEINLVFLKRFYKWRARFPLFTSFLLWQALYISLLVALFCEICLRFFTMTLVWVSIACFFIIYLGYWLYKRKQYRQEHKFLPIWFLQISTACFLLLHVFCWEFLVKEQHLGIMACSVILFPVIYAFIYRWSLRRRI